jgi:hypothetical protein
MVGDDVPLPPLALVLPPMVTGPVPAVGGGTEPGFPPLPALPPRLPPLLELPPTPLEPPFGTPGSEPPAHVGGV